MDDLGDFFRHIPVALYRTTPDGKLREGNGELARLLGFEDVKTMMDDLDRVELAYVDPGRRGEWIEMIASAGVVHEFDVELRRPDGTTIWVQDTARAVKDDNGVITHYDGALIDVTDKVEARKAKDEFLATVSHELRNPVAVVMGIGAELASNYDGFEEVDRRELVQLIARQAEEASGLIEDLLVAYRDDVSQVNIDLAVFNVVKEAERVLEVIDHPITVEVEGGEAMAYADPRRTRQILRNLVSNALRYGGEQIRIRVNVLEEILEVSVCDNGSPISPDDAERIFRPFQRAAGTDNPTSVGLGLSVARKLSHLMDGDVTYRHADGMTCFVLTLPSA